MRQLQEMSLKSEHLKFPSSNTRDLTVIHFIARQHTKFINCCDNSWGCRHGITLIILKSYVLLSEVIGGVFGVGLLYESQARS